MRSLPHLLGAIFSLLLAVCLIYAALAVLTGRIGGGSNIPHSGFVIVGSFFLICAVGVGAVGMRMSRSYFHDDQH
jgi:hypothetical protein